MPEYREVSVAQLIEPPVPLRMGMDQEKLGELSDSIKEYGVMLPLVVIPSGDKFEIVDGHRRFLASLNANLSTVPVMIYPNVDNAKWGMMLHANIMREDVTAAEEGVQFSDLAEQHNWSMPQLCKFFGRSEAYINDRVKFVREFPDLLPAVSTRELNWSQARAIMRCSDQKWRAYLVDQAVTHGASARAIQNMVEQWKSTQLVPPPAPGTTELPFAAPVVQMERPRCLWCARDDDEYNMATVTVHTYHLRDLKEFLARFGVNRAAPTE